MRNTKAAIILVAFLVLAGCKQAENGINDFLNRGTVHGLTRCLEINATEIASNEAIQMNCIEAIAIQMPDLDIDASARIDGPNPVSLQIFATNHSTKFVLVRGSVSLDYYKEDSYSHSLEGVAFFGIQPRNNGSQSIVFKDNTEEIEEVRFCKDAQRDNCYKWSMVPYGVKVR